MRRYVLLWSCCSRHRQYQPEVRTLEFPGWGGRIRTSEWRIQSPLPYRLATPQASRNVSAALLGRNGHGARRYGSSRGWRRCTAGSPASPRGDGPPARMGYRQHLGRHGRGTTVVEHAKAGGPAARHAGEAAARRRNQRLEDRPISGISRWAGPSRSLRVLASHARSGLAGRTSARVAKSSGRTAANTSAVPSGRPGLSSTRSSGWRSGRNSIRSPMPRIRALRLCRQARTSLPSARAVSWRTGASGGKSPQPGKAAQGGGRVGRAAADAGGNREMLVEPDRHARVAPRSVGQPHDRTVDDIAVPHGQVCGERARALDGEPVARRQGQPVAELGEHHHAVELVVAVRAPAGQQQVEIELGPRGLDDRPLSRGRRAGHR